MAGSRTPFHLTECEFCVRFLFTSQAIWVRANVYAVQLHRADALIGNAIKAIMCNGSGQLVTQQKKKRIFRHRLNDGEYGLWPHVNDD